MTARWPFGSGGPAAGGEGWAEQRRRMVEEQIAARGIRDERLLEVLREIPRHRFVPESARPEAYADHALPIGGGQTISQPYIVAFMTDLLELQGGERVLEVGTGSGYQAAVLSRLADEVFSVELDEELAERAGDLLADLGCSNVHWRIGDGREGWPEEAPFDGILVTAAPRRIPEALVDQLDVGGRLVVPVGDFVQNLVLVRRTEEGVEREEVLPVRFVPLRGGGE